MRSRLTRCEDERRLLLLPLRFRIGLHLHSLCAGSQRPFPTSLRTSVIAHRDAPRRAWPPSVRRASCSDSEEFLRDLLGVCDVKERVDSTFRRKPRAFVLSVGHRLPECRGGSLQDPCQLFCTIESHLSVHLLGSILPVDSHKPRVEDAILDVICVFYSIGISFPMRK